MKATAAEVAAGGGVSRKAPGRAAAEGSPNSAGILRVMHQSASAGPVAAQASAAMRDRARIFSMSVEADTAIHLRFRDFVYGGGLIYYLDSGLCIACSRYYRG